MLTFCTLKCVKFSRHVCDTAAMYSTLMTSVIICTRTLQSTSVINKLMSDKQTLSKVTNKNQTQSDCTTGTSLTDMDRTNTPILAGARERFLTGRAVWQTLQSNMCTGSGPRLQIPGMQDVRSTCALVWLRPNQTSDCKACMHTSSSSKMAVTVTSYHVYITTVAGQNGWLVLPV